MMSSYHASLFNLVPVGTSLPRVVEDERPTFISGNKKIRVSWSDIPMSSKEI